MTHLWKPGDKAVCIMQQCWKAGKYDVNGPVFKEVVTVKKVARDIDNIETLLLEAYDWPSGFAASQFRPLIRDEPKRCSESFFKAGKFNLKPAPLLPPPLAPTHRSIRHG